MFLFLTSRADDDLVDVVGDLVCVAVVSFPQLKQTLFGRVHLHSCKSFFSNFCLCLKDLSRFLSQLFSHLHVPPRPPPATGTAPAAPREARQGDIPKGSVCREVTWLLGGVCPAPVPALLGTPGRACSPCKVPSIKK